MPQRRFKGANCETASKSYTLIPDPDGRSLSSRSRIRKCGLIPYKVWSLVEHKMVAAELIAAYEATNYRVLDNSLDFVIRIGKRTPALSALLAEHGSNQAAFITAFNPFSGPTPDVDNQLQQAALRRDLDQLEAIVFDGQGEGSVGDWPAEPSLLALGITRTDAVGLGRK